MDWCKRNALQPHTPDTLEHRNKVNFDGRLATIQKHTNIPFAGEVLRWAEPKLDMLHAVGTAAHLSTTFLHDDLRWNDGGGNLKLVGDQVTFIDWELSGFSDTAPEIGDVLGSIPNTVADKALVRRLYETYIVGEENVDELNRAIQYGVLWGKLGNPLWAAERYFILSEQKHPDVRRYRYLAELGMEDAEPFFILPFEQWF